MLEHPDKLGATVEEIARTKVLITFPGKTIVSAPQSSAVSSVLKRVADDLKSPLVTMNSEVHITREVFDDRGMRCDFDTKYAHYHDIAIGLAGEYQAENAATAILAAHELTRIHPDIQLRLDKETLANLTWPGRCQTLQNSPFVLLDGAINDISARYPCSLVRQRRPSSVIAVLAVPAPKDLEGVCKEVALLTQHAIVTEVATPTLHWYPNAIDIARRHIAKADFIPDCDSAIRRALELSGPNDCVLLLGTQSFLGRALDRWNSATDRIW
jgi:dihydrofolate synthase/folylpolyglutamate synthase